MNGIVDADEYRLIGGVSFTRYSAPAVVRNGSSRCMPEEYAPDYFLGDSPGAASTLSADGLL